MGRRLLPLMSSSITGFSPSYPRLLLFDHRTVACHVIGESVASQLQAVEPATSHVPTRTSSSRSNLLLLHHHPVARHTISKRVGMPFPAAELAISLPCRSSAWLIAKSTIATSLSTSCFPTSVRLCSSMRRRPRSDTSYALPLEDIRPHVLRDLTLSAPSRPKTCAALAGSRFCRAERWSDVAGSVLRMPYPYFLWWSSVLSYCHLPPAVLLFPGFSCQCSFSSCTGACRRGV